MLLPPRRWANAVEAWRWAAMDEDQAEEWEHVLRNAADAESRPGEVREPGAPAWWHGEEDAAEGMLAMMVRPALPPAPPTPVVWEQQTRGDVIVTRHPDA